MKAVSCIMVVAFIAFVEGFWLGQSLAANNNQVDQVQNTQNLNWDDVKLIVKKNAGVNFSDDFNQRKLDIIEASKHLNEYNHPTWTRLRGHYLIWMATQFELEQLIGDEGYKGIKGRR